MIRIVYCGLYALCFTRIVEEPIIRILEFTQHQLVRKEYALALSFVKGDLKYMYHITQK